MSNILANSFGKRYTINREVWKIIVYIRNMAPPLGELAPPLAVTERVQDVTTPSPSAFGCHLSQRERQGVDLTLNDNLPSNHMETR